MLKGSGQSAARALARRREQINSTLSDRGRKLTHKLQERDRETWMMIGVATGLVLVLIAAYLFIRNRIKQQMTHEEEPSILLQGDVKVPEEKPKKNSLAPMRKAKDLTEQGRLLDEL
jgi:Tfp pilus assembly protein PilN